MNVEGHNETAAGRDKEFVQLAMAGAGEPVTCVAGGTLGYVVRARGVTAHLGSGGSPAAAWADARASLGRQGADRLALLVQMARGGERAGKP